MGRGRGRERERVCNREREKYCKRGKEAKVLTVNNFIYSMKLHCGNHNEWKWRGSEVQLVETSESRIACTHPLAYMSRSIVQFLVVVVESRIVSFLEALANYFGYHHKWICRYCDLYEGKFSCTA